MTDVDGGRYLFCAVDANPGVEFEAAGLDGGRARLVTVDGLGAVVQSVDGLFDTADEDTLTRWFLQHQQVVDAAGERFGTPVPFRFDTVVRGDDDSVTGWLRDERDDLAAALDVLDGRWEYRVELRHDADDLAEAVADDDRLEDLESRREDAGEGTAFLLEKQYDERLADLKRARHADLAASLADRLEPHVDRYHEVEGSGATIRAAERDHDGPHTTFALLAPEQSEAPVGDLLDDVAERDGVEVRYTGPWPPYTFTPDLGGARGAER